MRTTKSRKRPVDEPLPRDWWRRDEMKGRCYVCSYPTRPGEPLCDTGCNDFQDVLAIRAIGLKLKNAGGGA